MILLMIFITVYAILNSIQTSVILKNQGFIVEKLEEIKKQLKQNK